MTLGVVIASDRVGAHALAERLQDADVDVRLVVAAHAPAEAAADAITGREAAELLGALAGADVLVVEAARDTLTAQLVTVCDRFGVRIVALCDGAAGRRLAEMFGVAASELDDASLEILAPGPLARMATPDGRVIAVWGPSGAPGRTTLAIEIAGELARDGRRVGLVDADTHAPSVALLTGLADEGPGFAAACRAAERGILTNAELERIAVPLGDVAVLTGINRPGRWPELTSVRVEGALSHCRSWVDEVVIDVAAPLERDEEIVSDLDGPRRNAATLAVLSAADTVIAVVSADPVGVSRFVRAYADLRAAVGGARIHVVVNKTRSSTLGFDARTQVRRTLERYIGISDIWFVPWDPKAADAAVLQAQPIGLVTPRSALSAAVRRLVGEAIVPPVPVRGDSARARRATVSSGTDAGVEGERWSRRAGRSRRATARV
ncbi:P-loop NTPase [Microbacterium sp. VKM Ac-2870]|uniref:AAA family ATPase n=1 Tax=Microbacterium sp. VKM Ac-2870 TaxID=2783825 RepID=UPI00188C0846|nr:P-loop NTPase [Microbacterium sp. VKM Ac-2870]MBF4561717.1 P-loop NTPase [Microbacterium sp. VKM Ac-2870]